MTKAAELAKMGEVLTNSQIGGRRNIIINGAMQVAQRGTSASSKTTSDYFTCDRWRTEASGATYNTSQQTNSASDMATTGAEHFLRMEVTTGNNNSGISQKIEAQNIKQFKGEKLTLSFYAKGTNPNGGSFNINRFFSDDVNPSSTGENSSLTVTSSWVKYTYTFDYPDEGSVDMTLNTAKMALSFLQPPGDTSTNAWTLDLTAVQLEVGSQATPFEHRSFGEELALCERYFQKHFGTTDASYYTAYAGMHWGLNTLFMSLNLRQIMRAEPSASILNKDGTSKTGDVGLVAGNGSNDGFNAGNMTLQIGHDGVVTFTIGLDYNPSTTHAHNVYFDNTTRIHFDAEL